MATFKVLLDKRRKKQDETYPLVIRIYSGRTFKDINLKISLLEDDFDFSKQAVKRSHPNAKMINLLIKKSVLKVEETTLNLEIKEEAISADIIKNTIVKPQQKLNFFEYGEKLVSDLRGANRNGNANAYRDAIKALKTYSGRTELQFHELNFELLCNFENKMLAAGLKKNSIACYNRSLRAIFNNAINKDLVDPKYYPYRKYKIRREATIKRNMTISVILPHLFRGIFPHHLG